MEADPRLRPRLPTTAVRGGRLIDTHYVPGLLHGREDEILELVQQGLNDMEVIRRLGVNLTPKAIARIRYLHEIPGKTGRPRKPRTTRRDGRGTDSQHAT